MPWVLLLPVVLFSSTAEEVALKAEAKLLSLESLKARFTQTYIPKSLTTPLREKGEFYFKKKGLMKWVYQEPEEKIFLLKDGTFFFYLPEDKQLIKSSLSKDTKESEILELLSGTLRLQEKYQIEFTQPPKSEDRIFYITLTPKEEEEYTSIFLEIERTSWLIQKAIFSDWAGNTTEFHFSRIKTNISLPQDTFELKVPLDVEVIENVH